MKDSFIFYRSFYEAAKELNQKDRIKVYDAIFELALNQNETELSGASKAVFIAIKPQIIANNIRYENGSKGGRKKGTKNKTETKPNENQNETEIKPNENEECRMKMKNENEECINVNDNVFGLFETEFKRPLSSSEMIRLSDWLEKYDEESVTFALRSSIVQGVRDFNYVGRILEVQNPEGDY